MVEHWRSCVAGTLLWFLQVAGGCLVQGFSPDVDPTRSVGGRGRVLQGLSLGSSRWQRLLGPGIHSRCRSH